MVWGGFVDLVFWFYGLPFGCCILVARCSSCFVFLFFLPCFCLASFSLFILLSIQLSYVVGHSLSRARRRANFSSSSSLLVPFLQGLVYFSAVLCFAFAVFLLLLLRFLLFLLLWLLFFRCLCCVFLFLFPLQLLFWFPAG